MSGILTYRPALVVVLRVLHASKVGNEVINIFLHEAVGHFFSFFKIHLHSLYPASGKERCLTFPSSSLFQLVIDKYLVLLGC
jgi:hypothetical protein